MDFFYCFCKENSNSNTLSDSLTNGMMHSSVLKVTDAYIRMQFLQRSSASPQGDMTDVTAR